MLPTRPEGISAELWNLELPSILGAAHAEFREPSDPLTSPHSPAHSPPSYQSTQLDQESEPEDVLPAEPLPAACSTPPLVGDLVGPHDTKVQDDLAMVSSSSSRSGPAPSPGSGFTSPETHLLDWNVAECQMHLVLDSSKNIDFSGLPSPSHEADRLAQSILAMGTASFVVIAKLLDLLPSATNAKRRRNKCEQLPGQRSFSAGAFAIGGLFGIQNTTISHPWTTVLLTSILRGADPLHRFSSLTLQRNVMVHMHQDNNNEPGFPNLIVPCSRWRGGCLWVQAAGGAHALDPSSGPGTMIRIAWPGITFSPHVKHATTPWSNGDRIILVGFQTKRVCSLQATERHRLYQLGFRAEP